jgi:hypothetical protein
MACIGLTFILKYGSIINVIRSTLIRIHPIIDDLFKCSLCLGFWAGVIVYYIKDTDILLPLISACSCWFADALIGILQYYEIKLEKDSKR